jgi:hypothetical protein
LHSKRDEDTKRRRRPPRVAIIFGAPQRTSDRVGALLARRLVVVPLYAAKVGSVSRENRHVFSPQKSVQKMPCFRECFMPQALPLLPPKRRMGRVKESFVTWQLRRLHAELDGLDKQRTDVFSPGHPAAGGTVSSGRTTARDTAARRTLVDRLLRSLPRRLGYRDARTFAHAFARANALVESGKRTRRRLSPAQVRDLERRVMNYEPTSHIAVAVGCAEQTVLNRATQLRKRLGAQHEQSGSGI